MRFKNSILRPLWACMRGWESVLRFSLKIISIQGFTMQLWATFIFKFQTLWTQSSSRKSLWPFCNDCFPQMMLESSKVFKFWTTWNRYKPLRKSRKFMKKSCGNYNNQLSDIILRRWEVGNTMVEMEEEIHQGTWWLLGTGILEGCMSTLWEKVRSTGGGLLMAGR